MPTTKLIKLILLLSLIVGLANVPTLAQSFTLTGRPVSSAKTIAGGDFILSGSVGQPEAGPALSGGGFSLTGGVQFEGIPDDFLIYLPVILRN